MENGLLWLKGLFSAIISGAASSVAVLIVDPATFNFGEGIGKVGLIALISAIVGAANYLKQSPIPQ